MARPDRDSIRQRAALFLVAAAATAVAGAVLLFGIQPSTDVSDSMWRYPCSSSGAFVAFSVVSATMHALVIVGNLAFGHSGAAGRSRTATSGVALAVAVAGTALLLVGDYSAWSALMASPSRPSPWPWYTNPTPAGSAPFGELQLDPA